MTRQHQLTLKTWEVRLIAAGCIAAAEDLKRTGQTEEAAVLLTLARKVYNAGQTHHVEPFLFRTNPAAN